MDKKVILKVYKILSKLITEIFMFKRKRERKKIDLLFSITFEQWEISNEL